MYVLTGLITLIGLGALIELGARWLTKISGKKTTWIDFLLIVIALICLSFAFFVACHLTGHVVISMLEVLQRGVLR